jgi:hypothetical protein
VILPGWVSSSLWKHPEEGLLSEVASPGRFDPMVWRIESRFIPIAGSGARGNTIGGASTKGAVIGAAGSGLVSSPSLEEPLERAAFCRGRRSPAVSASVERNPFSMRTVGGRQPARNLVSPYQNQRARDHPLNEPDGVEYSLRRVESAGLVASLVLVLLVVAFLGSVFLHLHWPPRPGPSIAQSPAIQTAPARRMVANSG